jgi:hypothetical protein
MHCFHGLLMILLLCFYEALQESCVQVNSL